MKLSKKIFIPWLVIIHITAFLFIHDRLQRYSAHQIEIKKEELDRSIALDELFEDDEQSEWLLEKIKKEKNSYGKLSDKIYEKETSYGNTVVEQRSGRKRLYDQNIFLSAVFKNRVHHINFGDLGDLLQKAIFIDFGSAILNYDGAPTVRDIYEDLNIRPFLYTIIATDINDYKFSHTQYINIYNKSGKKLPFPVEEIDSSITRYRQVDLLINKYSSGKSNPVIFRSANSGPDLYYNIQESKYHLKAVLISCQERNVLYLFNVFVLFKQRSANRFQIIGEIDDKIGFSHTRMRWVYFNWEKRRLFSSFHPNRKYIVLNE